MRNMPGMQSSPVISKVSSLKERFESLKQIWRLSVAIIIAAAGWLFWLDNNQGLVNAWLPPEFSLWMPKPYQIVAFGSSLSMKWYFGIASGLLCLASFEDYHRSRVGKRGITPIILLALALITATLAIVRTPSDAEISKVDALDQASTAASAKLEALTRRVAEAERRFSEYLSVVKLRADLEDLITASVDLPRVVENYNSECMADLPRPFSPSEPVVHPSILPNTKLSSPVRELSTLARKGRLPLPNLDTFGSFGPSRPAPGEDVFVNDDQKYLFRRAYWKCKASEAALSQLLLTVKERIGSQTRYLGEIESMSEFGRKP